MECQECGGPKILPRYCFYCNQIEEFKNKSVSDILKGKKESDNKSIYGERRFQNGERRVIPYNFDGVRAFLNKQNSGQVQLVLPSQDEELKKDGLRHTLDSYYPAGKKESDNKLSYELDRNFIEAMAKRMDQNKGKYPPYNRQKPMDIQKLKEALTRHNVEIQKGNYDDEDKYDHLSAIACNAMFIYYQLKQGHTTKM